MEVAVIGIPSNPTIERLLKLIADVRSGKCIGVTIVTTNAAGKVAKEDLLFPAAA